MDKLQLPNEVKNLSLSELQEVLKEVKLYRTLEKQLGQRGKELFTRNKEGRDLFVVEYFTSLTEEAAYEMAANTYKKVFDISVNKEDIQFVASDKLSGGIKVYKNDSLVDLSFSKIEKRVSK